MKVLDADQVKVERSSHPIEIFARAYGLMPEKPEATS
jgi:hypothetical protein